MAEDAGEVLGFMAILAELCKSVQGISTSIILHYSIVKVINAVHDNPLYQLWYLNSIYGCDVKLLMQS